MSVIEKHCGRLERVGSLSGGELVQPVDRHGNTKLIGTYRSVSELDVLQVGGTVLDKPVCEGPLFENLMPGRSGCVYVWRNGRKPVLVGVKYDDGEKFLITRSYLNGSILQLVVVFSLMYGLGGMFAGGMLGSVLGLGSVTPVVAMLGGAAAVGWTWRKAWSFRQAYQEARAD